MNSTINVNAIEENKQNKAKIQVPLNKTDWQSGFDAGSSGMPQVPVPAGADSFSWSSGWIEGKAGYKK